MNSWLHDALVWLVVLSPALVWETLAMWKKGHRTLSDVIQEWRRRNNKVRILILVLLILDLTAHFAWETPLSIFIQGY